MIMVMIMLLCKAMLALTRRLLSMAKRGGEVNAGCGKKVDGR
jgi:hypothetical protein